jgi:protein TonB
MRHVYTPPRSSTNWGIVSVWAVVLALAVFLVLPLTQKLSAARQPQLMVRQAEVTMDVPDFEEPPPPPPEEQEEPEPPPPSLDDAPKPLNLNIDLDFASGGGGVLAGLGSLVGGDDAANMLDEFSVADLDKRPELIASVAPIYPSAMKKAKVEGTVTLIFILNEQGSVEDAQIQRSSRQEFERPALDALKKWKFKPGMKDGEAVRTYMKLPIRFRINA